MGFPKWLSKLLALLSALVLGSYVARERDGEVIELYRYVLTFIFGLMFYIQGHKKD
jgi:hypothetical protein